MTCTGTFGLLPVFIIYLLTAIGMTPGGISTVHTNNTINNKNNTINNKNNTIKNKNNTMNNKNNTMNNKNNKLTTEQHN